MIRLSLPVSAITVAVLTLAVAAPASAQPKVKAAAPGTSPSGTSPSLVGTWTGTATVPLPDSSIVVPVIYTFTQTGSTIGGTAIVPGQGSGTISNVARDGARLQFRVTAPEGRLLEHDGKVGADGSIEGVVNMDKQPLAKFKIAPKSAPKATPKSAPRPKTLP
jgi:hypothetical protein